MSRNMIIVATKSILRAETVLREPQHSLCTQTASDHGVGAHIGIQLQNKRSQICLQCNI